MKPILCRAVIPFAACVFAGSAVDVYAATTPLASFACNSAKPCGTVTNAGAGQAISAVAKNDSGATGSTAALNAPFITVNGLTLALTGGLVGNDVSGSPLIGGGNTGVIGVSNYSTGVGGYSYNTFNYGAGTDVNTFGAVPATFGLDVGPNTGIDGSGNVGVAGRSLTRVGGLFLSRSGYGAVGRSFTGTGVLGVGRAAGAIALAATSLAGGPIFVGKNATHKVATLDSDGNLILAGNIRTGDTAQFAARSANGTSVITYAGRQSMATIEDFGQVQMRSGYAQVQLDPEFAGVIDQHMTYMVFVTPEGDNHGIYVASKTFAGFTLRESSAGRSTLPLSYRIIAHAFGARDTRFKVAPVNAALSTVTSAASNRSARLVHE